MMFTLRQALIKGVVSPALLQCWKSGQTVQDGTTNTTNFVAERWLWFAFACFIWALFKWKPTTGGEFQFYLGILAFMGACFFYLGPTRRFIRACKRIIEVAGKDVMMLPPEGLKDYAFRDLVAICLNIKIEEGKSPEKRFISMDHEELTAEYKLRRSLHNEYNVFKKFGLVEDSYAPYYQEAERRLAAGEVTMTTEAKPPVATAEATEAVVATA